MKPNLGASEATAIAWTPQISRSEGIAASPPADQSESCLPSGSEIIGTVLFRGPAVINGKVEGKIDGQDKITVGELGSLSTDQLRADSIVIGGTVKVKTIEGRRIEILSSGRVWADLDSSVLIIHEGAQFKGRVVTQELGRNSDDPGSRSPKSPE